MEAFIYRPYHINELHRHAFVCEPLSDPKVQKDGLV